MAIKEMRRLEPRGREGPFERAQRAGLRAFWLTEDRFRRLQSERPELVVSEDRGLLAGEPRGSLLLHLAFDDFNTFKERFPEMFERLAAAVTLEVAPPGIFIRFADRPQRPYVEPILVAQAFRVEMEWLEMYVPELSAPEPVEPPAGLTFRPATAADAEALVALEAQCFPRGRWTVGALRRWIDEESPLWVATGPEGEITGYVGLRLASANAGVITDVAVHLGRRRHGLARALTVLALRELHRQGARSVSLTVGTENGPAIALYRSLGFKPGQGGVTYRRPTDPGELAPLLEKDRGTFVKFGDWR